MNFDKTTIIFINSSDLGSSGSIGRNGCANCDTTVLGDLTGHKFTLSNACKDVGYFKEFADGFGFDSYLAESLLHTYQSAVDAGLGNKLMASLVELHGQYSPEK